MKADVTIARDWVLLPSLATHDRLPPAGPVPGIGLHADLPCNIMWPPGSGTGAHKLTANVYHRGSTIALSGHDCGVFILHWCLTPFNPPNPLLLVHIPFSDRKVRFSSSMVSMQGAEVGVADVKIGAMMTLCADPFTLPIAFPEHFGCTVFVGVTTGDMLGGWMKIGIDVAAGIIKSSLPGTTSGPWEKLTDKLVGKPDAVDIAAALAKGLVDYHFKGKGKFEIGLGSPYQERKVSVEVERDKNGDWTPTKGTFGYESRDPGVVDEYKIDTTGKVEHAKTVEPGFGSGGSQHTEKSSWQIGDDEVAHEKETVDRYTGTYDKETTTSKPAEEIEDLLGFFEDGDVDL